MLGCWLRCTGLEGAHLFVREAMTTSSHLRPRDGLVSTGRAAFLLLVVWWAWIYTTWMVSWFDPASGAVRLVLVGATLASLLMSAAIPDAFDGRAPLFAGAYVALQVGRHAAGMLLLSRDHALRRTFDRVPGPPAQLATSELRTMRRPDADFVWMRSQ